MTDIRRIKVKSLAVTKLRGKKRNRKSLRNLKALGWFCPDVCMRVDI